ncbi:MAG: DUF4157 domain-containing protein, partial [Pseudonocardiaceae bacterium]|nr:DUF4157 domain-containing protein [Pseudonocardiaceae bacterium]
TSSPDPLRRTGCVEIRVSRSEEGVRSHATVPASLFSLQRLVGNRATTALMSRCNEEAPEHATAGEKVRTALRASAQSLDGPFRTRAESFLGADLSHVRVHTDRTAAESARAVRAQAYTSGSDMVFDQGWYDTASTDGQQRLVHELTHVVQQQRGPVAGTVADGLKISDPSDRFEREADEVGHAFVTGKPAGLPGGSGTCELQRFADNRAVSRLVQRDPISGGAKDSTVEPQQRDALLAAAKSLIEQGLKQVSSCPALAAQLLGAAQGPAPSAMPGPAPQATHVAAALVGKLEMSGTQLDTGLGMYEKAGGQLADIPAVLKVRGHISGALFFARQVVAGTPIVAHQVFTFVQATMPALAEYRAREAASLANPKQGPVTAADAVNAAGESAVLRARYLGPLGSSPRVSP